MDTNLSELSALTAHYSGRLRVRVCGICLEDKKILLIKHQNINQQYSFWSPPGGGLLFGEKIKECLVREFKEETGLDVLPGRFLFMHEFLEEPLHAIELFFEVKVVGGELKKGSDPELGHDTQLIQEVAFKSLKELRAEKNSKMHLIFENLIDLDDIFIPVNHFL